MNSIERIWTALNLEIPDRVPLHTVAVDGNLGDEILGKYPKNAFDLIDDLKIQNPDNWTDKMNEMLGDLQTTIFSRMIEAAAVLGYDACPAGYIPFIFQSDIEMTDVFGRRYKIVNNKGNVFPYYIDGMIKDQKDWENFPKPDVKEICKRAKKLFKAGQDFSGSG